MPTRQRLERIRLQLEKYEERQRALLAGRTSCVVEPGEDIGAVTRAWWAKERGRLMLPVLGEAELAAFERQHGVSLPDEYRLFLGVVGNGGEGPPYHGLFPLERTVSAGARPAEPFPLRDDWIWEEEEEPLSPAKEALRAAAVHHGSLALGEGGCGEYWLLILNGPERGHVWDLTDVGMGPLEPRRTFLSWYEEWLAGEPPSA